MKVGIIRFSSLGDVILASAVLEPLYKEGAEITFITFKPYDELFGYDYRIKEVLAVEKKQLSTLKEIKAFSKNLKDLDVVIDLHSNLRSRLISFFSKKQTLRYDKRSLYRRLLTKPGLKKFALKRLREFNVVNAYLEPVRKLGFSIDSNPKPKIILNDTNVSHVLPKKFVALGTGARYKGKMYPFYPEVANILIEKGFSVVLVGSESDKKVDKRTYPSDILDLRGKLSLIDSLKVLARADFVISNDSAIAHMARAVSTLVLMIYGATHPAFGFYPFEYEGAYLYANLPCQPCDLHGKKECKYKNYPCFEAIKPEVVVKKALKPTNLQQSLQ